MGKNKEEVKHKIYIHKKLMYIKNLCIFVFLKWRCDETITIVQGEFGDDRYEVAGRKW
jgi:hypothetical protein